MKLRPITVKNLNTGKEVVNGWFHKWTHTHTTLGERSVGGPLAIVEDTNGKVLLIEADTHVLQFTDRKGER